MISLSPISGIYTGISDGSSLNLLPVLLWFAQEVNKVPVPATPPTAPAAPISAELGINCLLDFFSFSNDKLKLI